MNRRLAHWLLIPLLVLSGCSRKSGSETEAVPAAEGSPPAGGPATTSPGVDSAAGSVVAQEGSGGGSDSQVMPLRVDDGREILVQSGQPLTYFAPFYPFSKRMEGVEGQVVLQFVIDRLGRVINPTVGASTVPEFNQYALEAARDWRFLPALADGKPIDMEVSYPVSFYSERGSVSVAPVSFFSRLELIFDTYYLDGPDGYEKAEFEVTPIYRQVPTRPTDDEGNPITGRVLLSFTVTTDGQVRDASVIESTNTELEMPALTAIKYWRFIPRIREGQSTEARVNQPISFNIADPEQEG